jgi:1-acyl-sn-glycerol-3-phosphate acyltransferase
MIRDVLILMCLVLDTAICAVIAIGASLWKKGGDTAHLVGRVWARSILFLSGVRVSVRGMERISPGEAYVYMANHQSMFDILSLLAYLPVQFRWLAKRELFGIPVFGYAMARAGYVSIDRSDRKAAHQSLLEAAGKIAGGVSVVVFPEGSRSPDGRIQPFKPGGFHLALRSGRPIVPVVICGAREVLPKGKLQIRPGHICVSINPPVETSPYKDKKELMAFVRTVMEQDLEKLRQITSCGGTEQERPAASEH